MNNTQTQSEWAFEGSLVFYSPINKENSFGSVPLSNNTKSEMTVKIRPDGTGYFEWEVPELDEYETGGLTFDEKELTDYDGVFALPVQLLDYLTENGYNMEYARC